MSINSIVEQMEMDKEFINLRKKIKLIEIQMEMFETISYELTDKEARKLLEAANILAASDKLENKKIALEIVTTVPLINQSQNIAVASMIIMRKLGNFPAIKLLEARSEVKEYKEHLSGITYINEHLFELRNIRNLSGENYLLTNFQKRVVDMIEKEQEGISITAPTSAGKSFIFLKILLDMVKNNKGSTVVYIVPTRALIKQVMNDFIENIKSINIKEIYVGCSSEIEMLLENPERSNILVLTQERLYQLCSNEEAKKINLKMLVIDEAHNIQYGGRGILLENSIKVVKNMWEDVKILFSSPLINNPKKLLDTFDITNGLDEIDDFPLVRQNIINVKINDSKLELYTKYGDEELLVGIKKFEFIKTSSEGILAGTVLSLYNNQNSIIYANGAMASTDIIRMLFESGNFKERDDERLDEFADFIEEYIDSKFELAKFIRCGLAFHFSGLPPIIRSGIEELFAAGAFKIVCCTSTLLEGVNMPAKNIFIYKPEKGLRNPIDNLSFWNLAGRAGRIGNDFSGNILCINTEEWANNPLNGERHQEVVPSSEKILVKSSITFKEFISNNDGEISKDDYNEQLFSLIIKEHLKGRKLENSKYSSPSNKEILKEIDSITNAVIDGFKAPKRLLSKNPGIMPEKINDLWSFFENNQNDINYLLPVFPLSEYGYDNFRLLVQVINNILMKEYWSDKQVEKVVVTGYKWMMGVPLNQLIFFKSNQRNMEDKKVTKHVKNQVEFINDTVRYKLVKYIQTYVEVLRVFLESIGKKVESEKVINIAAYLEYGACRVAALEFMALGLHREAAVKLSSMISKQDEITTTQCIEFLRKLDVEALDIESYLKKQIFELKEIL